MCEQYARHLASKMPFRFSQVGVPDKEVLNNAHIFTGYDQHQSTHND